MTTGAYFGIFYDRSQVVTAPRHALCQCEIEYCRTRGTHAPDDTLVLAELEHVAGLVESILESRGVTSKRTFYSKLTFLRDVVRT